MKYFLEELDFEPKSAELKADVNTNPSSKPQHHYFPSYCFHVKQMADFVEETSSFCREEKISASHLSCRYHTLAVKNHISTGLREPVPNTYSIRVWTLLPGLNRYFKTCVNTVKWNFSHQCFYKAVTCTVYLSGIQPQVLFWNHCTWSAENIFLPKKCTEQ